MQSLKNNFLNKIRLIAKKAIICLDLLLAKKSGEAKTIAIIRTDAIGDFIVWTAAAYIYREIYPNHKIVLIGNSTWADLAKKLPYWDFVIPIDIKKFSFNIFYRIKIAKIISSHNFSHAIQPTFSRVFLQGDSLVRMTKAKNRIGYSGDLSNINRDEKKISDEWYTELVLNSNFARTEIEKNDKFISTLSNRAIKTKDLHLPNLINLSPKLKQKISYFVVFPGASWVGKQWPASNYIKAIEAMIKRHGLHPVLCGSKAEIDLCENIGKNLSYPCTNLAGQTSLPELIEIIRESSLLISNDSSAVHIAAFTKTPTVCILGGGHFGRFLPYPKYLKMDFMRIVFHEMPCYNCNWQCNQMHEKSSSVPCITNITVSQVLEQCEQVINQ